jgi:hypothetical protein
VKTVDLSDATLPLAAYLEQLDDALIIVAENGEPLAALTSLANVDWETISLSTNPHFLAILECSRQQHREEGGISLEEMRQRLDRPPDP